jgi:hypothetical protein
MPPTSRRPRTHRASTLPDGPRSFKDRLSSAKRIAEATDDGYVEVVKDDRVDYCGFPMLVNKWEVKRDDATYNGRTHARVWAEVDVPDKPEPVRVRFWDMGGRLGDQLLEFERCGTTGNVAAMLDAREYNFDGGIGYEFFLTDIPEDEESSAPTPEEPSY